VRFPMLVALVAMALSAACAKLVVVPVTDKLEGEGVFYALPKTVARVQLKVDRTVRTAAPYSRFAPIFAPDGRPACKEKEDSAEDLCKSPNPNQPPQNIAYSVEPGATFSTFGEPDPDNVYLVKFVGRGAIDQTLSMTWNEVGLLSAASAAVTNRTTDVVVSGLKLVAGVGTRAGLGSAGEARAAQANKCPETQTSYNDEWVLKILQANAAGEPVTKALVANYCDIPAGVRDESFHQKRDEELLDRATKAYILRVAPLADARSSVLKGGSTALDPIPLLNKLDSLIDEQLKALYLGSTATQVWDASFDIRDLDVGKESKVLAVETHKGICFDPTQLAPDAKPLPAGFVLIADKQACDAATQIKLKLEYHPEADQQLFTAARKTVEPTGERSFRYRIPAQVRARLANDKGQAFGTGVFSVAQLGCIVSLPARRHSRALSYDLAMMEATGGLKTFKLGTTGGLDAATVDALTGVGTTVLDARNAARKAKETAEDEVTLLTREKTLLELKDKICDIQKKYGLTCTIEP
jgi:hypothetical protein